MLVTPSSQEPDKLHADLLAKFFSGLSHPVRYRLVAALAEKESSVSELVQLLGCSQSQVSNHLACLKWCGYVTYRQEGKHVYYQVTDKRILEILKLAQSLVADNAEHINSCTRM
ncbi:MAG: ArsR/SmtB family transcription factor [Bacillota bacterium]